MNRPIARVVRGYERVAGRGADVHFCVSRALKRELDRHLGIADAVVLYDDPTERFRPAPRNDRSRWLRELLSRHFPSTKLWKQDSDRPACIVCPTSWSDDEDFAPLLDAISLLEKRISESATEHGRAFPDLLILITGRGPLREAFEGRIAARAFENVKIRTAWFSADDYPRLLAAADLGLCFHRSTSGVDLPMKLAEMFGAGLPVCALDYGPCLAERFEGGGAGLLFGGSQQLADQIYALFVAFPRETPALDEMRAHLAVSDRMRWEEGWRETVKPILSEEVQPGRRVGSTDSLRVGFFHPDLGIGGAERWLVDAACALQAAGHRVTIVTSHWDRERCFEATRDGTLDVRVRGGWFPAHVAQHLRAPCAVLRSLFAVLGTSIRGERYDVTFVDLVPHVVPVLRRVSRAKIVYYCHFPDQLMIDRGTRVYRAYRWSIDRLEARAVAKADRVLVNSRFTAEAARRVYADLPASGTEVLYPGIAEVPIEEWGESETDADLMLLCVSRFDRKKRLRLAVEALASLEQRVDREVFDRVRLVIAGGYDDSLEESALAWQELQSLAEKLGLAARIQLLKSPSDEARDSLLSRCRCVIYTPESEHFGLVPLEAMAAGRPVVAARSGGPIETILDGETGWLCDATPECFADAIARLLTDPEACARMGRAGQKRAAAEFSLDAFSNRLTEIVEELADARAGARE